MDRIVVRGARTHNLKAVDLELPRERLVVFTGPSGSGKSSLAFNTIYAEGRRRYVESLSVYARQLLGPIGRPEVDFIDGLSPAIAIEQRSLGRNPRSTVGTVTEIDDHLRLLFARAGTAYCPRCGREIHANTVTEIVDRVVSRPAGTRLSIMAPAVRGEKGAHAELLESWRREGFVRVRAAGALRDLSEDLLLDPRRAHDLDLVIDRIALKDGVRGRVLDAVELALKHASGLVRVVEADGGESLLSERFACAACGITLPAVEPGLFSCNSPSGACPRCNGLGVREQADLGALVPDPALSLRQGALAPWRAKGLPRALESWARAVGLDLHLPWRELPPRARDEVLYGDDDTFVGVLSLLEQRGRGRSRGDDDDDDDEPMARARFVAPCDDCGGTRLRPEARCVKISGRHIGELSGLPIAELQAFLRGLTLPSRVKPVVERVRHEIVSRLAFLESVGLPYLSLGRAASTLSGGEGQRVRLATQLGSSLVGVLYVLDEPSVGLHPSDAQKLLQTLRTLVQRGNSVLVVEHDLDTIRAADWVVDLGPAAGILGGRVVAQGTPASLCHQPESVTGPWLSGRRTLGVPSKRRNPSGSLDIVGARRNNLKDLTVSLPLGCLLAVTGVSGSGKSSLILGTLVPLLRAHLQGVAPPSLPVDRIDGLAQVDRLVAVDATPLGRTPRSSPATYMGIFAQLREVFSAVPEARARGWKAGRFSFNVKGGRCETCQGEGVLRVEMHFLPDVLVPCEACGGSRYEPETLHVRFRGHSIADVLGMTVDEASGVFDNLPRVRDLLLGLRDVGLGYLHLGQPASTLSGGEAQRVKLARELSRRGGQRTLYVLDEPTTGLHMADIELLLHLLERLVEQGHSVLVIEHNLELIKRADRVLDLGPEGGDRGGRLVAQGTPEEVARVPDSLTGVCLREALQQSPPGLEGRAKGR